MPGPKPPLLLRLLLLASLAMCSLTLAFGFQYTKGWWEVRRGRGIAEQRTSLTGVTWFKRPFVEFVERLKMTVPPDAKVLVEPTYMNTPAGRARWFLFLNYYAYPLEFYVRLPKAASGTLVDYQEWVRYNWQVTTRPEKQWQGAMMDELLEIEDRGIEWKLRIPFENFFPIKQVELFRLVDGEWQPVELRRRRQ